MKKEKIELDISVIIGCVLSFVVPLAGVLIGYAFKGVAPFGDRTICSMDGFSQYYPMLENMSEAIKEGELFYSFNGALGFNLWAQSAYYTNSPLWFIIYFLPHAGQLVAINLLTALKFSLASVFFYYRLCDIHDNTDRIKKTMAFPALSVCYGLSGYMLAFVNQLMWTDVIVLLPLLVLGIEKLHKGKKPWLYLITLFLTMWTCFYLGYMVCIFAALYFLYLSVREPMKFRDFFRKGLHFAFYSVMAAGLAAVVLIPVYKALSLTLASELGFEGSLEFKYTLKEMLLRLLPFREPSLEFDAPNLFFGIISAVWLVFALLCKKIDIRRKLFAVYFLAFMFLTMSLNLGEYVWHGFHYPNQLPGRQSFLFIFLALSFLGSFIAAANIKKLIVGTLSVVICLEMCANACVHMKNYVWASQTGSIRRYDYTMSVFTSLDDEADFMRIEWADVKKNNYPQQYSYKGITYYSSTMSADAYNFFQQLGIPRYAKNVSVYYWQSDITNALFGIRYILQDDGITVRKNNNALPLAFVADKGILEFDLYGQDAGEQTQQALWLSLVGEQEVDVENQSVKLRNQGVELTEFDTDRICGTVNVDESGVLVTTIGYDGGWRIYIDGEEVPVIKVAGYLCGVEIGEGAHEIEMVYTVPGIVSGGIISALSLVILLIIGSKKRKIKSSA